MNTEAESPSRIPPLKSIGVAGFKSIRDKQTIAIAPLTILAGANSSGKSSVMQPLLLMKQTLEAPFDPGALAIAGPYSNFTRIDQMLFRSKPHELSNSVTEIQVELVLDSNESVEVDYSVGGGLGEGPFYLKSQKFSHPLGTYTINPYVNEMELMKRLNSIRRFEADPGEISTNKYQFRFERKRCFFEGRLSRASGGESGTIDVTSPYISNMIFNLLGLIYVPARRGDSARSYPIASVERFFPGMFPHYFPSLINKWIKESGDEKNRLETAMRDLGFGAKIQARPSTASDVELFVSRLGDQDIHDGSDDLVNLADVGIGVAQALPVITALIAAHSGGIVYIDQPELHLHPRAQITMAKLLADAAEKGVRVVVETHSELLLLSIQTLVAEGYLSPRYVKLHWFERDKRTGVTTVASADLDSTGRFGDWPEDFGDTSLTAEGRYLDAAEARLSVEAL
jgi:hypothetical protein